MQDNGIKYNRREFIQKSILGASVVNYSILSNRFFDEEKTNNNREIITRSLGKTGINLPIISMGVMNTLEPLLIIKSYELGIRHFDTARVYMNGQSEIMLGNALKRMNVRDKVIISTKAYLPIDKMENNYKLIKSEFIKFTEESLRRLQTDYTDILYYHAAEELNVINNPGIMEAMQELKQQQKIKCIGFSTHNKIELIKNAIETKLYDVILTIFNYVMRDYKAYIDILRKAANSGIGLIAMKTQCAQPWDSEEGQKKKINLDHSALLKFVMRNKFFTTAIPGYTNFGQMNEDLSVAYNLDYNEDELIFLKDVDANFSMKSFCRQCSKCVETCPYKVDIPRLIRAHSYATCYPNIEQARQTLNEMPETRNINNCMLCKECTALCANRVNIAKRINELKSLISA